MKDNLHLKRGLIIQSLSPVFFLLIIKHFHRDYIHLFLQFFTTVTSSPCRTIKETVFHPHFGEFTLVCFGLLWIAYSRLSIRAFNTMQISGFRSKGEKLTSVEEQKDAPASFLMTFILPLLIDDLSTPQYLIAYLLVIGIVCIVLYQSNLYYQSPVLSLWRYRVFKFKVQNPKEGLEKDKEYVGITRGTMVTESTAVMMKHIADNVYLVYNEGNSGK